MKTVSLVDNDTRILLTYETAGNGMGYSAQYVVLLTLGDGEHVLQGGSCHGNKGDAPEETDLRDLITSSRHRWQRAMKDLV